MFSRAASGSPPCRQPPSDCATESGPRSNLHSTRGGRLLLSRNLGANRWKEEVPEVAHALLRAASTLSTNLAGGSNQSPTGAGGARALACRVRTPADTVV